MTMRAAVVSSLVPLVLFAACGSSDDGSATTSMQDASIPSEAAGNEAGADVVPAGCILTAEPKDSQALATC